MVVDDVFLHPSYDKLNKGFFFPIFFVFFCIINFEMNIGPFIALLYEAHVLKKYNFYLVSFSQKILYNMYLHFTGANNDE